MEVSITCRGEGWLTSYCNNCVVLKKYISWEWTRRTLMPIYRNGGYIQTMQITVDLTYKSHYET